MWASFLVRKSRLESSDPRKLDWAEKAKMTPAQMKGGAKALSQAPSERRLVVVIKEISATDSDNSASQYNTDCRPKTNF